VPGRRHFAASHRFGAHEQRPQSERFKPVAVKELLARDRLDVDIFRLRDESLDDVYRLAAPEGIAAGIVENLQAALEAFRTLPGELAVRPAR
jgi:type I restriction enzyme M protein